MYNNKIDCLDRSACFLVSSWERMKIYFSLRHWQHLSRFPAQLPLVCEILKLNTGGRSWQTLRLDGVCHLYTSCFTQFDGGDSGRNFDYDWHLLQTTPPRQTMKNDFLKAFPIIYAAAFGCSKFHGPFFKCVNFFIAPWIFIFRIIFFRDFQLQRRQILMSAFLKVFLLAFIALIWGKNESWKVLGKLNWKGSKESQKENPSRSYKNSWSLIRLLLISSSPF